MANLAVLPFWAMMLLFPKAGVTKKLMKSNLIFLLLGGTYSTVLAQALAQSPSDSADLLNPTLDGIVKLLGNRQGAFLGWVHFLAFDLFIGRWIYFDSLERGKPARLSMLLTLFAGPLGLLFYLGVARPKNKKGTSNF